MRFGIVALAAAALLLVGCVPQPDATPTPSATALPFATDEEAFAAAEATYRAYVDALNQVDLQDPETFEAVYAWTTGDAHAGARESFSQMHANGLVVSGASTVTSVHELKASGRTVQIAVCLRVADVELIDRDGVAASPPDRPAEQSLQITMTREARDAQLLIERIESVELSAPCAS
jgi:hypothetical protein